MYGFVGHNSSYNMVHNKFTITIGLLVNNNYRETPLTFKNKSQVPSHRNNRGDYQIQVTEQHGSSLTQKRGEVVE